MQEPIFGILWASGALLNMSKNNLYAEAKQKNNNWNR